MNKKIKVYHIVDRMETGGMENGVVNICNNLDRDIFEPSICCLRGGGPMLDRLKSHVNVIHMRLTEGIGIQGPLRVARLFSREQVDVVHTHAWGGGSLFGVVGGFLGNVPVVINGEHGVFWLKPHQILVQRMISMLCDATLSVSTSLKRRVVENLGIAEAEIVVVPNGVDVKRFSGAYDKDEIGKVLAKETGVDLRGSFVISCIGSLKSGKNQIVLLHALKRILKSHAGRKVKVLLVGEGPDRAALGEFVQSSGLVEHVAFLGKRDDVPQILSVTDLMVSVSIAQWEGMSNVILEAMASGVPVLATRSVGTTEIVNDGENGFLVESNDIEAVVNKVELLLNDFQLLRKLGLTARETIRSQYSLERMVRNYEDIYLKLLSSKQRIWHSSRSV